MRRFPHFSQSCCSAPAVESLEARVLLSAPDANWRLAWADEFNGSSLDHTKWSIGLPFVGANGTNRFQDSNSLSYIEDSNVVVGDGTLKLLTDRRDVTDPSGRVFHYTEGAIHSAGSFSTTYGYFEMRAQLPANAGPGIWPAFWMLGNGWPPEDDIAEWETSTNRFHQGLAYGSSSQVHWNDTNTYNPLPTGFHTYGMEWGPGYQIFSMDGLITHVSRGSYVPSQPMELLLNNQVESKFPPTSQTVFPNALEVDYVRVYKRTGEPTISNGDFEGGALGLWTRANTADVIAQNPHAGTYALRTTGAGSSAQQVITGLSPNTTYVITACDQVSGAGTAAQVGVKDFGGAAASADTSSTIYAPADITFTTGPSSTSATVYAMQTAGNGSAWFDDFAIHQAATIENGGFESGALSGWTADFGAGAGASVTAQRARHGRYSLREDGAGTSVWQTIYGLAPNTTYELTGAARVTGAADAAQMGVQEQSGAVLTATASSKRYTPLSLSFTTGPTDTSATIFCSKPIGSGSAWFDDLRLSGPIPLTISPIRNQTVRAGRAKTIRFKLGGVMTGNPPLLAASSSDPALLLSDSISFGGDGPRRKLTIAPPIGGSSGTATLTVSVTDSSGRSAQTSLVVRVVPARH